MVERRSFGKYRPEIGESSARVSFRLPPPLDQGFHQGWLFLLSLQSSLAGASRNPSLFRRPFYSTVSPGADSPFIQVMNVSPPYLRVGPVAIHIRSREANQPTSPLSDYSSAEPALDVQGSVFLSPDSGLSIEELNGVVSKFLIYYRRISYEEDNQVPSDTVNTSPPAFPSLMPPSSPSPLSVASTPHPSISSSVANADYVSAL